MRTRFSWFRDLAVLLPAIVIATTRPAFATTAPPVPTSVVASSIGLDTTALGFPYIQRITFGRSLCAVCPPIVCPDEPVVVTVSGVVPAGCVTFRGLRELPVAAPFTALRADFVVDTCGLACPALLAPFSGSVLLSPQLPGFHSLVLGVNVRSCPDTNVVAYSVAKVLEYNVVSDCRVPIDTLVRSLTTLRIVPERPCDGDSLTLVFAKNGCPPCVDLTSLSMLRLNGFRGTLDWRPDCVEFACFPETLSMPLGRFAAGSYFLAGSVAVHVLDTANPDSMIVYRNDLSFEVARTCDTTTVPCMFPFLRTDSGFPECALVLPPGGRGDLKLFAAPPVPLGGIQGRVECQPPFRVTGLRVPDGVSGLHLSWAAEGRGARYVLFSDAGAPIPAGKTPVLTAELVADYDALAGARASLAGVVEVASDPAGGDVTVCSVRTLSSFVAIGLCVLGNPGNCDANGDGRADVRDLVLMTRCFQHVLPEADSLRICRDCDGNETFEFNDLFCCAREILRLPLVPRDSVQASDQVSVTVDDPTPFGEGLLLHVHIRGAEALGAAMVRLRYPADRWSASLPLILDRRPGTSEGWMPLTDVNQPGLVHLGGVRLAEQASSDIEFFIVMAPIAATQPGDRIETEGADLAARDGTVLTPSSALPSVELKVQSPDPPGGAVELGPASPNPFGRTTSFVVNLPHDAEVDLAVHDLAGRRVGTLVRGRVPAGRHSYTWDGAQLRDGVYFVRLQVDGRVLSTRVALLRERR